MPESGRRTLPLRPRQFTRGHEAITEAITALRATQAEEQAAQRRRQRIRRVCRVLIALYAAWLVKSWNDKTLTRHWGSRRAALVLGSICKWALAACGVSLTMAFSGVSDGSWPAAGEVGGRKSGAVFTVAPHGVGTVAMLSLGGPLFRTNPALMTYNLRLAGASILFRIPILRELLLLLGGREATRSTIRSLLADGCCVAVNPGGIHEQVHTSHRQEAVYAQERLGFVRLAMAAGKPIIPSYCFGENQLFRTTAALRPLQLWILRKLRIGLPLFSGVLGIPFGPPLPTRCSIVVGHEVSTGPPNADPSEEQVEEVFERYCAEIRQIFSEHAHKYLPPEVAARGLRIERIGSGVVDVVHARL